MLEGINLFPSFYENQIGKDVVIYEYKQLTNFLSDSELSVAANLQTIQEMLLAMKETDLNNFYPNFTVLNVITATMAMCNC